MASQSNKDIINTYQHLKSDIIEKRFTEMLYSMRLCCTSCLYIRNITGGTKLASHKPALIVLLLSGPVTFLSFVWGNVSTTALSLIFHLNILHALDYDFNLL